jgi:hypothetical protein
MSAGNIYNVIVNVFRNKTKNKKFTAKRMTLYVHIPSFCSGAARGRASYFSPNLLDYWIKKEINKIFTQFHNSLAILFMSYYPPK